MTVVEKAWAEAPGDATAVKSEDGKYFDKDGNPTYKVTADGKSSISMEDYAIALIDELEHPQHIRQRFTVAY